ncbi:hypothetical protein MI149_13680 [Mycolicibacterium crocinum]|uniref:Uncharacterized protein n=1 Tax=Mycolicibacterium crocinum TaxID=388459 RepID=A0ABY3TRC4_9MYCO|nr:hypothetical protein [Mycolicibacterium crocinum]ULN44017.1 hypothetical protein MI149_13680 [Mycolicibacterium crocinum]
MTAGRVRLRRRLLLWSAPVVLLAVVAAIKMISVVLIGDAAVTHFNRGDGAALHADASRLGVLNLIEPAKAPFARGFAAVLEGRLDEADTDFARALADDPSCPVRVSAELVRETQGDVAAAAGRTPAAEERYRSALRLVTEAPANCFAGNDDSQADRRAVRAQAEARLNAKIAGLHTVPPPPELNAAPPPPPPPPPPPAGVAPAESDTPPPALGPSGQGLSDISPDRLPSPGAQPSPPHQLGGGDPLDRLRQLLTDAASSGSDAG